MTPGEVAALKTRKARIRRKQIMVYSTEYARILEANWGDKSDEFIEFIKKNKEKCDEKTE